MKNTLKWIKRILAALLGLILVVILVLWVSFYFWTKDVVNNLPKAQIINTDNGPIEYSLNGDSDKYILMVHGTPGSVHVAEGKQFVEQGYTILGVSRPGYYQTPLSSGKTPKEQAALYGRLLDKLNIDSVYVYGMSGGGPSSIQFALDYPKRCAGLVLYAAVSEKFEEDTAEKSIVNTFFKTEFGAWLGLQIMLTQVDDQMKKGLNWYVKRAMLPKKSSNDGYENDDYQFRILEDFPLEKMAVPTLIFHGNKDDIVPFSFGQNLAKRIPNATLFEMKGKGHNAAFSSYRDTINQEMFNFLESQEENKN